MRTEHVPVESFDPSVWIAEDARNAQSDVFQQIGQVTRQLHDTLEMLGVMPRLQLAATGLPDARSRLSYIAEKCGVAADKVLTSVDLAKAEQQRMAEATRAILAASVADSTKVVDAVTLMQYVSAIDAGNERINAHLTDIMMAQDYHDLTGQVVAKVVALAIDLEDSLVKILVQSAPVERAHLVADSSVLAGPVIDATGRSDVVANQSEVDDLLATLGF